MGIMVVEGVLEDKTRVYVLSCTFRCCWGGIFSHGTSLGLRIKDRPAVLEMAAPAVFDVTGLRRNFWLVGCGNKQIV